MNLKSLLPESRKLRVMLATLAGYLLHCAFPFLTPDQVYTALGIVGAWLGVQGVADAGTQGAAIAKRRAEKGEADKAPPSREG